MAQRPQLILAAGKEKSLLRRHPWIFSGAIKQHRGELYEGCIVDVLSASGQWMASGYYQDDSIAVKVLSYDTPKVDPAESPDFLADLLAKAIAYRNALRLSGDHQFNAYRLINGEGDFIPGLIADYYDGIVVLQAHSLFIHQWIELIAHNLMTIMGTQLHAVIDKSSSALVGNGKPGTDSHDHYLLGEGPQQQIITEGGYQLKVDLFEGQKTGFFLDQRINRQLVGTMTAGKQVLNLFGYTGGFSVSALTGGAQYVETVDVSKKAIALCNENISLNGQQARHRGIVADAMQYLNTLGNNFDVIILDPPAFAKNHRALQQGLKGYRSINQKALEHIAPQGLLFTFSCSQAVDKDTFQTMVFTAAANAHRRVRIVQRLSAGPDHPVSIYHPEGEYLKGLLLYVE